MAQQFRSSVSRRAALSAAMHQTILSLHILFIAQSKVCREQRTESKDSRAYFKACNIIRREITGQVLLYLPINLMSLLESRSMFSTFKSLHVHMCVGGRKKYIFIGHPAIPAGKINSVWHSCLEQVRTNRSGLGWSAIL